MFVKELSFLTVGMDNMLKQFMLSVFIIDHLAAVHQCFDACNKILRVLPSLATTSSGVPKYTWMLTSCVIPRCIFSRKVEAFTLVALCSSSSPKGIHCACMSWDLVTRAAKMYWRWSSLSVAMQLRRNQFSRVHQKWRRSDRHLSSPSHKWVGWWM